MSKISGLNEKNEWPFLTEMRKTVRFGGEYNSVLVLNLLEMFIGHL